MIRASAILCAAIFCGATKAHDVTGQVIDAQTGKPIQRARVSVGIADPRANEPPDLVALTDEEGRFSVLNLTQNTARLTVEKSGYLSGPDHKESALTWVDTQTGPIVFSLVRQAVVEGRIVDETGKNVKTQVFLWRRNPLTGSLEPVNWGDRSPVDDDEFRFYGLEAGTYFAQVRSTFNSGPVMYPQMFYPHASTLDSAKPILLQPGQEEHLEFQVTEVLAHKVRGRFSGSANALGSLRFPGPTGSNVGTMSTDEKSQTFEISGVPAGTYVLEMSAWSDNKPLKATQTIVVENHDLDGVSMSLVPIDSPSPGR